MSREKIAITGGNGFIGSHIIREFLSHSVQISCIVRKQSDLSNLEGCDVQICHGDILKQPSLIPHFIGKDCVIHNAALARDWGAFKEFSAANVEGTLNVLAACVDAGVKQVILTGTCSVYGEENYTKQKDELHGYHSHYKYFLDKLFPCKMNYYRDTKTEAQKKAIEFAIKNEINLTILNPVWVYGEREFHTGFYEYLRSVKEGMSIAPGSRTNKFHVIYAGDLAKAFYLAFKKKLEGVHAFIIGNEEAVTMDRIYSLFCKAAGLTKPRLLPKGIAYPLGFILELAYTFIGAKEPPVLTRGRVNMFYDNIEYSTKKAAEILGFTNRCSLEDGIKKTVAWYKSHNFL